jgi:hypothetical protein
MCFKKSSSAPAPAPAPVAAAASVRPPAATPPVTERSVEVEAASRETRMNAKKRRGIGATLLAGETGGYQAPAGGEEKKTLLG